MALDDNVIQSQKYTSFRRLQLFLNAFVPLAATRSPNPQVFAPAEVVIE